MSAVRPSLVPTADQLPAVPAPTPPQADPTDVPAVHALLSAAARTLGGRIELRDRHGDLVACAGDPDAKGAMSEAAREPILVDHRGAMMAVALLPARADRASASDLLRHLAAYVTAATHQRYEFDQRMRELTALYNVSLMLAEARDLDGLLSRTVRLVAEVMEVKACSIRLLEPDEDELVIAAVHNLSDNYLAKGPIKLSESLIDQQALSAVGYELVEDMRTDPRVQHPELAAQEGLVTVLSVGMRYKGQSIGVLKTYSPTRREFDPEEIELQKAIAAQAAAAIVNARLAQEARESEQLERQVMLAADVQQRMVPSHPPTCPNIDFGSIYVPCFELAGDLFDFIELPQGNWGVVVADVSGKGLPASLIMASVRAYLRSAVGNVYDVCENVRRINEHLVADTKPEEFVSLWYGVFDAPNRRLTYTCAGHPPGLLLRDGEVMPLTTDDMVLGVLEDVPFHQRVVDLKPGDRVLLYTDGLPEARNFNNELFGDRRVVDSFRRDATDAEAVAQNVLWDMRRFVGLKRRTDDITIVTAVVR